ncbi:GNAT family N-acetyltransferase [Garicola koreensis]|uniref:Ribosomal protein S18 acetylase RimI-like enzyme n=1 Tax=Garicola koreensis TaxID=1262554 RepID=A0A7W5TWD5_9MICC|nr:GNAT family N-acetyltransferase [Garicola koreensis]MBB3668459.1 ribosomal protein S18 acetylase RimI-like enzyme [Garicola koreensis]
MNSPLMMRPPHAGEAARLARVHTTSWKQAYQGVLPDRFWDAEALTDRVRMWSEVIADQEHRSCARVAELNGNIIGVAMVADPRDDDVEAETELLLIYLLAEHYGSGAADALLTDLLGEASASLWVLKSNQRAQAFYRKHGFAPDGEEIDLGGGRSSSALAGICEIRMTRPSRAAEQEH